MPCASVAWVCTVIDPTVMCVVSPPAMVGDAAGNGGGAGGTMGDACRLPCNRPEKSPSDCLDWLPPGSEGQRPLSAVAMSPSWPPDLRSALRSRPVFFRYSCDARYQAALS